MKIRQKLTLGFVSIAILVAIAGYITINKSQKALEKNIGQESATLAVEILDTIDRNIYKVVEHLEVHTKDLAKEERLLESNANFERLDDIQQYIAEKDKEWVEADKEKINDFMAESINNALSQKLREEIELEGFYKERYGYPVFGEVFLTNKFGANVAQTNKTSDYYQADENWWQAAKKDGLYVANVKYDESAGIYSIDICVRIDDNAGNFLGVMKAVVNIQEIINVIKEAEQASQFETREFELATGDGRVIYSTGEHKFFEELPEKVLTKFREWDRYGGVPYFIKAGDTAGEGEELITHAHSKGYKDYRGLGWILVVEHETGEIFAPVIKLKKQILIISSIITLLAVGLGILISRYISEPIKKLTDFAKEIASTELGSNSSSGVKSNDEIGELAQSFENTIQHLQESTTSIHNLNKEIVERKRAEEELKLSKKQAEAANEAKSQFLANMSHEIRTPMNAIMGFCDILADDKLTEEQREYINIIRNSGKHLLQVINDILDISRIEAEKVELRTEERSLAKLLNNIESIMLPAATEKGLQFGVFCSGPLPAVIWTDHGRTRQCLMNLIGNAIKFTEKGHVHLNVSLEDAPDKSFIRFDVEDTGIGIPPDKHDKIFASFSQIDNSSTRKYGGTGLGLTITRQLAELLGGNLSLTSEAGSGSVFSLVIPTGVDTKSSALLGGEEQAGDSTPETNAGVALRFSGKVLVVEDNKGNQALAEKTLRRLGFEVETAEDGKDAIEKAFRQSYELIFMDIQMPKMDGYEATRTLRREGITTPIIALTAYAMAGDSDKCIKAGCDDYISKPMDKDKLLRILNKYAAVENIRA